MRFETSHVCIFIESVYLEMFTFVQYRVLEFKFLSIFSNTLQFFYVLSQNSLKKKVLIKYFIS